MIKHITTTPAKALEKLKAGNARYIDAKVNSEDISQAKRTDTLVNGQKPYAIIITCSDSRVIPENIFMTGIGELFVIRIAGNVIDCSMHRTAMRMPHNNNQRCAQMTGSDWRRV